MSNYRIPEISIAKLLPEEYRRFSDAFDAVDITDGHGVAEIFADAVRMASGLAGETGEPAAKELADSITALVDALDDRGIDAVPGLVDTETCLDVVFLMDGDDIFDRIPSAYGRKVAKTLGIPLAKLDNADRGTRTYL